MDRCGVRVPVIAKLEKPEAVADLEAVVAASAGIMVARGDLGVELPLERVPVVQKRAVQLCREHAKPVIVATQMLARPDDHAAGTALAGVALPHQLDNDSSVSGSSRQRKRAAISATHSPADRWSGVIHPVPRAAP